MEGIKEYLLSVTAAAILCGCVCAFHTKKDMISALIRLLCGVFMTLTVLSPVVDLPVIDLENYLSVSAVDSHSAMEQGLLMAEDAQCAIIKEQIEAYILDKAALLECDVEVTVALHTEAPYEPIEAQIRGDVSPYAKAQLTRWIEDDLGIAGEDQKWIG